MVAFYANKKYIKVIYKSTNEEDGGDANGGN